MVPDGSQASPRELTGEARWHWIFNSGWKGTCPQCGKGKMFRSWLQIAKSCDACGMDFGFATPDDGPAFFSMCLVAMPLTFFVVWFQVAVDPPMWVHLFTSVPLMIAGCILPLRPIKGWLVASQYINNARQAGTEKQFQFFAEQEREKQDQE